MPEVTKGPSRPLAELIALVQPYIPDDAINILNVRCTGPSLKLLAEEFPQATVYGANVDEDALIDARDQARSMANVHAWTCTLRHVRVYRQHVRFNVVLFLSPAGSYKKQLPTAISSLTRAVAHSVDLLEPGGRIIIVRSKALGQRQHVQIPTEVYRKLFGVLQCTVLDVDDPDQLVVAELNPVL